MRFVANTKAAEAGKAMVDTYNEEVAKENSAARKASQAEEAKAKNAKTPKGRSATAAANKQVKLKARGTYKTAFEKVLVDPTSETQFGATWGIDRLDQRSLPLSGTFTSPSTASNVFAYVVDTGIDATNLEFGGRVNSGFDAVNGGSGQIDCNGHGTHVAGTIASQTYGVAKAARLVPVRVLDCNGSGTYSGVIAGLDWIAQNRPSTQRAVVNMSLGGGASSSIDSAVASLVASGVAVVVAAGNSNTDACTTSPARATSAITVGATTINDSRASFSNYGSCLDLFAPGANITSTIHRARTYLRISVVRQVRHLRRTLAHLRPHRHNLTHQLPKHATRLRSCRGVCLMMVAQRLLVRRFAHIERDLLSRQRAWMV